MQESLKHIIPLSVLKSLLMKYQISQIPHAMILQSPLICFHNIDWPIEEAQHPRLGFCQGLP